MKKKHKRKLILASKSSRRQELLAFLGFDFTVQVATVDEEAFWQTAKGSIEASLIELARKKAISVLAKLDQPALVLAADTIVVLDQKVLNKPASYAEAKQMLKLLSGRSHQVLTAVSLYSRLGEIKSYASSSEVCFYPYDEAIVNAYLEQNTMLDKAGAYGIQEFSAVLIKEIKGDYYNIMGLPLASVYRLLKPLLEPQTCP